MDINRNQWFMVGLLLAALGAQFRFVESFTLNPEASRFVTQQLKAPAAEVGSPVQTFMAGNSPSPLRTVVPPKWLGWSLISAAAVLILHSLAMKKP